MLKHCYHNLTQLMLFTLVPPLGLMLDSDNRRIPYRVLV
jgi:hypothetical protein